MPTDFLAVPGKVLRRNCDPRVHAALNCASLSCPRLRREAFEGSTLEETLDAAMAEFVGEVRNCTVNDASRTVTLSRIFNWFASDFVGGGREGKAKALIDYVNRYRPPDAQIPRDYRVTFFKYDKRINKQ